MSKPVCTGACKQPSYAIEDLIGREAYRDRPVVIVDSNGKSTHIFAFCGKDFAVTIIFKDNVFFFEDSTKKLVNIDRCFWDHCWKPLVPDKGIKRVYSSEILPEFPCSCEGDLSCTIEETVGQWAFRDRPVLVYIGEGDETREHEIFEFCGLQRMVKVQFLKGEYTGVDLRGNTNEIDKRYWDSNWRTYSGPLPALEDEKEEQEVEAPEEHQLPSQQLQTQSLSRSSPEQPRPKGNLKRNLTFDDFTTIDMGQVVVHPSRGICQIVCETIASVYLRCKRKCCSSSQDPS